MHTIVSRWGSRCGAIGILLAACSLCAAQDAVPDGVRVRRGFELSVVQSQIPEPRFLLLGPDGTLYVSVPDSGQIKACRDLDGDGSYEAMLTFVDGYRTVHGMFWHDGWLWFTQSGAIHRARDTDGNGSADQVETVLDGLPSGGHWWRSILIHDGRLYTSIGDSGNITDERETKRQKIWSYAMDGSDERLFCSGLRNTEKLVVRPGTDEIWGMDHGSDRFGRYVESQADVGQPITDLNPPDEMNHYQERRFYGHPFIVGNRIVRYEFLDRREEMARLAAETTTPEWCTGAHWAPNAMTFYSGDAIPGARGDAFVAYHGSWNRSSRAGYCITRVLFEDGLPYGEQVCVSLLTANGEVLGRPVDVIEAPDGSLLFSDDQGNRIYRLRYVGEDADAAHGPPPPAGEGPGGPGRNGPPPLSQHPAAPVEPVNLQTGPLSQYDSGCARCHGEWGSQYEPGFHELGDERLRELVREMMLGPAQLQPSEAQVDAMTAYHRALQRHEPFVCIVNGADAAAGRAEAVRGEASPDSTLVARPSGAGQFTRDVAGFTLASPPQPPFTLLAGRGGQVTELRFPAQQWSHAAP